jgi:hypothetical protein
MYNPKDDIINNYVVIIKNCLQGDAGIPIIPGPGGHSRRCRGSDGGRRGTCGGGGASGRHAGARALVYWNVERERKKRRGEGGRGRRWGAKGVCRL